MIPKNSPRPRHFMKSLFTSVLTLMAIFYFGWGQSVLAQQTNDGVFIKTIDTGPFGFPSPAGLGYSNTAGTFFMVEAPPASNIVIVDEIGGLVGTAAIAASLEDPINTTYDNNANRLLIYQSSSALLLEIGVDSDGVLQPNTLTSVDASAFGLSDPNGMTVDPATGDLYILDAVGPRIVRIIPDPTAGFAQSTISSIDLAGNGLGDLRGIAFYAGNNTFHIFSPSNEFIYEVTTAGQVVRSRDIALGLINPQAMTFAPSGDQTDDPGNLNLYIANSKKSGADGNITELRLNNLEAAPVATVATGPPVAVPDVVGLPQATAEANIVLAGLIVGTVTQATSATVPAGSVISQNPAGGGSVTTGSTVDLVVSSETEPVATLTPGPTETQTPQAVAAAVLPTFVSTLVNTTDSSAFSPPSPDTSGATYVPNGNRPNTVYLADSEVNEFTNPPNPFTFGGENGFIMDLDGTLDATFSTVPFEGDLGLATEPTGLAYNSANLHLFVANDDANINPDPSGRVSEVDPGADGDYGTPDDTVTSFSTGIFGNDDPEGITYDSNQNVLFIVDGLQSEVYRLDPGPNGIFDGTGSDDTVLAFDTLVLNPAPPAGVPAGAEDPEGIAFDTNTGFLYIVGRRTENFVFVMRTVDEVSGDPVFELVQVIDVSAAGADKPAGLAFGPSSTTPGQFSLYMTDRGVDNNSDPNENDGKVYEMSLPIVGSTETVPDVVDKTQAAAEADILAANLIVGTVTTASSPTIVAGNVISQNPAAGASAPTGSAVDLVVSTGPPTGGTVIDVQVSASDDDAEESPSGFVSLTSSDLELVNDGNDQTVGMRFNGVAIPPGATINEAYVQFTVDEATTAATNLTVRGEKSVNPGAFASTPNNITLRPPTIASVPWVPATWPTVGLAGLAQRTTDIKSIIQEIIGQGGWASGNSVVILITGTGKRTAESFNGDPAGAAVLHVDFSTGPPVLVEVPDVVGLAQGIAEADILAAGLTVGTVTPQSSGSVPAGDVISQDPVNPTQVPVGSAVNIVVSIGNNVVVPDVVDKAQATAESDIVAAGLTVGTVTTANSQTIVAGNVISQNPVGGASAPSGSAVDLVVSLGPAPGATTIDVQVSASDDDAEESAAGSVGLTSSDLELVQEGSTQTVGMRFQGVAIPPGATITNAYVQFQVDEATTGAISLSVGGELSPNPVAFTATANNITGRTPTGTTVPWSPADWPTVGLAGVDQRTSDITGVIQEIIGQGGWASGNSVS